MKPCLSPEQLELLTSKKLGDAEQTAVETHISGCTACQDTLVSLRSGATQAWTPKEEKAPEDQKLPTKLRNHPLYRVTGVLGRGGMGMVYKAEHRLLGLPLVLKVNRRDLVDRPEVDQRFQRESRLTASLASERGGCVGSRGVGRYAIAGDGVCRWSGSRGIGVAAGLLPVAESWELIRQAAVGLQ